MNNLGKQTQVLLIVAVTVFGCICFAMGVVMATLIFSDTKREPIASVSTTVIPTPTAIPDNLLTLKESREVRGERTDLQWDEFRASLKGKRVVDWQGTVGEVREGLLGDYYYVEVDIPGNDYSYDVTLYVTKDVALSLQKGQQITFSGTVKGAEIRLFGEGFTTGLENVTFSN